MSGRHRFEFPNSWVIIAFMVFITAVLSWVIPSGSYEYAERTIGGVVRRAAIDGTFRYIDKAAVKPADFLGLFAAFYRGCVEAADIFFVMFFCTGTFSVMVETGAFHAGISSLLKRFGKNAMLAAVLLMFFFGICGSAFGMLSEFYGFYPFMTGLGIAVGCDAMFGFAIIALGEYIGFMAATTNPYTLAVAQTLSGLPLYSAGAWHVFCFAVFMVTCALYVLWYGKRVAKNPEISVLYGYSGFSQFDAAQTKGKPLDLKMKFVIADMLVTLSVLMVGLIKYSWGYAELCALFLAMSVFAAAVCGWSPNRYCGVFSESTKKMFWGAMLTGLAKAMMVIMQDAQIIDTVTYMLTNLLKNAPSKLSAQLMLVVHTLINFPIASGSGKALITMPIMAPLADNLGLTRQVACSAFLFGDGLTKLLWPTGGCVIVCAMAGVPYEKWLKWFLPLCGILYVEQMLLLQAAVSIGL